jgi:hypothetical protein
MGSLPKRRKGTEKVTTLGVTSRMTMTSSGFWGMSFDDMISWLSAVCGEGEAEAAAAVVRRVMPAMRVRLVGGLWWWWWG